MIDEIFSKIDRHTRKASVAAVGGFRPPDDPLTSWFGGHFFLRADEEWPSTKNGPMVPLLQVRVSELPFVPEGFPKVELVSVFIDRDELPLHTPARNGDGWCIRTYRTLEDLIPCDSVENPLRPFPVHWSTTETDGPSWHELWMLLSRDELSYLARDHMFEFFDRYSRSSGTKIGGWPAYIQGVAGPSPGRFLIQIATESKCGWCWGDAGSAYLFIDSRDDWHLHWDCY